MLIVIACRSNVPIKMENDIPPSSAFDLITVNEKMCQTLEICRAQCSVFTR